MTTTLPYKAIVIIRDGQKAIASHLLEYSSLEALDHAVSALQHWAGCYEVIIL